MVTEVVLIATGFIVYAVAILLWVCRCLDRGEAPRSWAESAPVRERLLHDPRLVGLASLPLLAGLVYLALRAALLAGS